MLLICFAFISNVHATTQFESEYALLVDSCTTPDLSDDVGGGVADLNEPLGTANITGSTVYNGGATQDENVINNSQTDGTVGIRQGVATSEGSSQSMVTTYTITDGPVCDFSMDVWDIDRTDQLTIQAFNDGTPVTMTMTNIGAELEVNSASGLFLDVEQTDNIQINGDLGYAFTVEFNECVDEIVYSFWNNTGDNNFGGSYTVTFNEGCTELDPPPPLLEIIKLPCGEDATEVTVTPTFGTGPYTYAWENADGTPFDLEPCIERDWANFQSLDGVGADPVANPLPNIDTDNTVEAAINSEPFIIQGAVMTIQPLQLFGGASVDEEIINDSQETGTFALRTGVDHNQLAGGLNGAYARRIITFSQPVCNLEMFFNDIDNNDIAIINPRLNGVAYTMTLGDDFTFSNPATNVIYQGGNLFDSAVDSPLGPSDVGGIDFTFSQCIDEIEIIFYDNVAGPGVGSSEGGSYSINFPPTCDYGPTETLLPPGCYNAIVFDSNGDRQTFIYCIEKTYCALGNYVWIDENADGIQDAGEPGIAGVTVTAEGPNGTLTTVTDSDGGYIFKDLEYGKYDVQVDENTLPSGMNQTTNPVYAGADFGNQDQSGAGYSITISEDEPENMTGDFGYIWEDPNGNQGTAAIGDRVWYDANSDGVQDPGEAGIGGVTVTVFYDPDGDGIKDAPYTDAIDQNGNTSTGITLTEPDGTYIFYNLPAGAYSIVVDPNSAPLTGLTQTGDPDEYAAPATMPDNQGESVVLAPGDVFLLMDFGSALQSMIIFQSIKRSLYIREIMEISYG